mgnify:CR=1 FL=1
MTLVVQLSNPRPFKAVDPQAYSIPISKQTSSTVKGAAEMIFSQLSKSLLFQKGGPKKLKDIRFQVTVMKAGSADKLYTFKAEMKQSKSKDVVFKVQKIKNPIQSDEVTLTIKRNQHTKGGGDPSTLMSLLPPTFISQPFYYDIFQFDQAYIDYWNLNMWSAPYWSYSPLVDPLYYYPYSPLALPTSPYAAAPPAPAKSSDHV